MPDYPRSNASLARLLKGLAPAPGELDQHGGVTIPIEAGGIRRRVLIAAPLVAEACRSGLASQQGRVLSLSPEGRAWLARLAEPEAPFLAQHRPLARRRFDTPEGSQDGSVEVLVDEAESPLAWMRRRRGRDGTAMLDDAAFAAGERLRADFTRANLTPRVTANWEASIASGRRGGAGGLGGDLTFSDVMVAARQRVQAALAAVGPELSGVVQDVCCFLKGIEEVERERGWPVRSGKVVLMLGLQRLAGHYGLGAVAQGPARGRARRWAAPDARPAFPHQRTATDDQAAS